MYSVGLKPQIASEYISANFSVDLHKLFGY
jgi:hypothetical protein